MCYSKRSLLRFAASFILMGVPLTVQGQEQPAPKEQPAPRESENNSRYVSEQRADNGVGVELHSESSWDNNILGTNTGRVQDYVFEEGGLLRVWTNHQDWKLGLEYRPNALLYRTLSNLNQLDHRVNFENEFHAARHLLIRLRDSLDYATGVLEPRANPDVSLPIGGSPNLNTTLFTPFARQFANEAFGEAEYEMSLRSSFRISGSQIFRRFSSLGNANLSSAADLLNTQADIGGAGYSYRFTRHFTGSLEYQYQEYRFGKSSHDKTHSAFLKLLWEVRPHITLSVFGGPQYSDSEGQFLVPSTNPLQPGTVTTTQRTKQWGPGGGGSVTLRSNQTVFRLTAQRLVGDGGGLLPAVTNSYEAVGIRRQLTGRWDVAISVSNARTEALQGLPGKGAVNAQTASVAVEYPLLQNLNMHLGYNYLRQRTNQFVVAPDMDRNRFTLGLFFHAHDYRF